MDIHYYMLCYRSEALIASNLEPEAFGLYMSVGTHKNTRGNLLFFEIDNSLQSSYFNLTDIEKRCQSNEFNLITRTKYISIYRVLEHLDLSVFGDLYLSTADGRVMQLGASSDYNYSSAFNEVHLYQELCPVPPMVVSSLDPGSFVKFMTSDSNPVHVPRLFFADMLLNRDDRGRLAGYLPYEDQEHIEDCIREVEWGKQTKTVFRSPHLHSFFRTIKSGFYLGDQSGLKFYKFPSLEELEVEHSQWWHSATESLLA